MDTFEKQRKIFSIDAVLMLLAAISLAVVIPRLIQEASTDPTLKGGVIATAVALVLRLLMLLAFLYGIRLTKRRHHINKRKNLDAGIILLILGFIVMDGAFAFLDSLLFVSIGMFVCAFCDFVVTLISGAAFFILKPKKKN